MLYQHKNGIEFRKIEAEDLEILRDLKSESWSGTHRISIVNMYDQEQWFKQISQSSKHLYLMAVSGVERIGLYKLTTMDHINRNYDSAHDVFLHARGQGWGYKILEAGVDFGFEVLNMYRINTEVLINNVASQKTAEFAGFIKEGLRKEVSWKCGEYIDSIVYGILRKDWENLTRVKEYGGICNTSYQPKS